MSSYIAAFPEVLRHDCEAVVASLGQSMIGGGDFNVRVREEVLTIPIRIYHDMWGRGWDHLTSLQREIAYCLLSRHHNGFVREEALKQIIGSNKDWTCPFVVQLAGEYVIPILELIAQSLSGFQPQTYREFLLSNMDFYERTRDRIVSYWDVYRRIPAERYPGFKIMRCFDGLVGAPFKRPRFLSKLPA